MRQLKRKQGAWQLNYTGSPKAQVLIAYDTHLHTKHLNDFLKYYTIWSIGKRATVFLSDTTLTVTEQL